MRVLWWCCDVKKKAITVMVMVLWWYKGGDCTLCTATMVGNGAAADHLLLHHVKYPTFSKATSFRTAPSVELLITYRIRLLGPYVYASFLCTGTSRRIMMLMLLVFHEQTFYVDDTRGQRHKRPPWCDSDWGPDPCDGLRRVVILLLQRFEMCVM